MKELEFEDVAAGNFKSSGCDLNGDGSMVY